MSKYQKQVLHTFRATWGIPMKVSGSAWFMIML